MPTSSLPENCQTCGAPFVSRTLSRQFADTEEATYKCGAVYHTYLRNSSVDVRKRCSQDPAEVALRAREEKIDKAVAAALNRVKATYEECEALPKRMERDKGWYLRSGVGIWTKLPPKPKEKE